jgi:hypothetical protein
VIQENIRNHIKTIQRNPNWKNTQAYNAYILGIHQYYAIASHVYIDFSKIAHSLTFTLYNRLKQKGEYKKPRSPPKLYKRLYSMTYKTYKIGNTYLYPIADVQWKIPLNFNQGINDYTHSGRMTKYNRLKPTILNELISMTSKISVCSSLEYADNRLSKYSMQNGKCSVSGIFLTAQEVHCHHILPKSLGGTDAFNNLVIVHKYIHKLIHATEPQTIVKYLHLFDLSGSQIKKLNQYREQCNLADI